MRELVNEAVTIDTKLFIHDHSQLQVFAVKDETGKPDKIFYTRPRCHNSLKCYRPVLSKQLLGESLMDTTSRRALLNLICIYFCVISRDFVVKI